MKPNLLVVLSCLAVIASGCSKSSSGSNAEQTTTTTLSAVSETNAQKIANETNQGNRLQLLLKTATTATEDNDLNSIIKLHSDKKLSHDEFRTLFWNAHISKNLIQAIQSDLDNDGELSPLDKTLIQSIAKGDISFDILLDEIKNDHTLAFPKAFQSILIDELLKSYNKDFNSINNDTIKLSEKLEPTKNAEIDSFLANAKKILEINFYKRKLSQKRLVTAANTTGLSFREIKPNYNLSYSFNIGRCGNYASEVQNFTKLSTSFGRQCNTETPSVVNLDLSSDVTQYSSTVNISLLLNSFVKGGYDKGHSENATSILNYNLAGKIVIPKCENPSFCNQIVSVTASEFGTIYNNSNVTNDGVSISINGSNFANTLNNRVTLDISKNDAVIDIRFTGSKKHIGACCFNSASFQKVNLTIQAGSFFQSPLSYDLIKNVDPFAGGNFFNVSYDFANNLNTPPFEVSALKQQIQEVLKDKTTLDNYRPLFYNNLDLNQMTIDTLMSKNSDPLSILNTRQVQTATSDIIGRNMILPIINSKILAYQSAQTLNVQKNLNEMIKSILQMNLNSDDSQEEIKNQIASHVSGMDAESQEIAKKVITELENNKKDQKQLLSDIETFQNEVSLISKKMNLEMELLNLEKAQFEELSVNGLGKVQ